MILKFSFLKNFLPAALLMTIAVPLPARTDQGNVSVYLNGPGNPPVTGQLVDGSNGLYLDSSNGQSYFLSPGQGQIAQDRQIIQTLEQQNAMLRAEIQRKSEIEQQILTTQINEQKARAKAHQTTCRNLLWTCQLPSHPQYICNRFIETCSDLESLNLSTPAYKPLGETDALYPSGYLSAQGIVKGPYQQILGYVAPKDINSALIMAETANEDDHNRLPAAFQKSSKAHPYKASYSEIEKYIAQRNKINTQECGELLLKGLAALTDQPANSIEKNNENFEQARQFFTTYNQQCHRRLNLEQSIYDLHREMNCLAYQTPQKIPTLERLNFLRLCGADPTSLNPQQPLTSITDCYTLNHFCQVKRTGKTQQNIKSCQDFQKGQCLNINTPNTPHLNLETLPKPFWEKGNASNTAMLDPKTNWPDCLSGENAIIEGSGYFLGKISEDGLLTLYSHGAIFKNIAQITHDGGFVKYSKKYPAPENVKPLLNTFERRFLERHFRYLKPIAADGSIWYCGKDNHRNKNTKIKMLINPKGELIKPAYEDSSDNAFFTFESKDIRNLGTDQGQNPQKKREKPLFLPFSHI